MGDGRPTAASVAYSHHKALRRWLSQRPDNGLKAERADDAGGTEASSARRSER